MLGGTAYIVSPGYQSRKKTLVLTDNPFQICLQLVLSSHLLMRAELLLLGPVVRMRNQISGNHA